MAQSDDRTHDSGGRAITGQPLSEAAIQLEGRHLQPRQIGQRTVTGTKVVDGQLKTSGDQIVEVGLNLVGILHQYPFSDLQLQLTGLETMASDAALHQLTERRITKLQRREIDG